MTTRIMEACLEVFPVPHWQTIRESLKDGFDEIFPDVGEEVVLSDGHQSDRIILWRPLRFVKSVHRIELRDWFLFFLEPIMLDLYDNGLQESAKSYPMDGDMRDIAQYMLSVVRKDLAQEYHSQARSNPLGLLWSRVPQEQRDKFPKNMQMRIFKTPADSMDGQEDFFLEITSCEECAWIEKRTAETVNLLLNHPVEQFDAYIESLLVPGETRDIMKKLYSERYLQHIRTVMINRIWCDIYRAIQEPEKDWHFEYRESDLAQIIEGKGSRGGGEVTEKLNVILKQSFPETNIIFKIGNPHWWHAGEYNPPILIDVWSRSRREAQKGEDITLQYATAVRNDKGEPEYQYHGVAVGGKEKEITEFIESRTSPPCARVSRA